jgi:hypothetical protein
MVDYAMYSCITVMFLIGIVSMLQPWKPTSAILLESWTENNDGALFYYFTVIYSLPSGTYNCTCEVSTWDHYRFHPEDDIGASNLWFNQYHPTQCAIIDSYFPIIAFTWACLFTIIDGIIILISMAFLVIKCIEYISAIFRNKYQNLEELNAESVEIV